MNLKEEKKKIEKEINKLKAKLTPLDKELTILKNKEANWQATGNELPKYLVKDLTRLTNETQIIITEISGLERRRGEIDATLHVEGVKKQREPMEYEIETLYEKLVPLLQIPDAYIICLLIQGAERQLQNTSFFKYQSLKWSAEQLQVQRKIGEDAGYSAEDMQFSEFNHDPLIKYEETRAFIELLQTVREALRIVHTEAYHALTPEEKELHRYDPVFQVKTDEEVAAYWEDLRERKQTKRREQQNAAALAATKVDYNAIIGK